MLLDQ